MRKWIALVGVSLVWVCTMWEVSALAQAVVAAAPVPVQEVKDSLWWQDLANAGVTAVTGFAALAIPIVGTFFVGFLRQRSKLAAAVFSNTLLDRMEKGAIGIINAEAEKIKQRIDGKVDTNSPAFREEVLASATDRFAVNFKESLDHFGKNRPSSAGNFVLGRLEQALNPPAAAAPPTPFASAVGESSRYPMNK